MKNKRFFNETLMVFLMAALVFSIPSVTASDVEADAKRDAEKDAKSFNKLKWFAGSCLGGALPYLSLFVLIVADDYGGVDLAGDILLRYPPEAFYVCIGTGALLPMGYAIFHSPTPHADRFLGKSSDYVNAYTAAYRRRIKRQRIALSATGCIVGTCLGISSFRLFLEEYETID